jgi:hypothetical protein
MDYRQEWKIVVKGLFVHEGSEKEATPIFGGRRIGNGEVAIYDFLWKSLLIIVEEKCGQGEQQGKVLLSWFEFDPKLNYLQFLDCARVI